MEKYISGQVKGYSDKLSDDLRTINENKDQNPDIRKRRITSIALRVLGGLVAVLSISPAIATVVSFVCSPLMMFANLAATVMGVILAHDLIKMGNNIHNKLDESLSASQCCKDTILIQKARQWF